MLDIRAFDIITQSEHYLIYLLLNYNNVTRFCKKRNSKEEYVHSKLIFLNISFNIVNTHCYTNPPLDLWAGSGISFLGHQS